MRAGIALGSNLGDRLGYLREGKRRLRRIHEGEPDDFLVSPVYQTEPVDCLPDAPSFLNAVLEIESKLGPLELLDRTQRIESELGRPDQRAKNSPRTLDVDLLYLGDHIIDDDRLALPHPRAIERRFVLEPLRDIRPDLILPGMREKVSVLLSRLPPGESAPALFRRTW